MADTRTRLDPSLSTSTLKTIADLGFRRMTPVQAAALPLCMSNKDVAAEAVTGSGKTLAFVILILEILLRSGVLVCTDVMARGVDIPEVNWVIQYDPPKSSNAFVHRCGRTARIGHQGNALAFLLPTEETYMEFISINQKNSQWIGPTMDRITDVLPKLKKMAIKDRDMYEKGMKAFVSFIRAYHLHECSLIFRFKDLDIGKLASGFGLLKVPKMKKLKVEEITNFSATEVDLKAIPYKDKNREKQRQKRPLATENDVNSEPLKKKRKFSKQSDAWSKKKERKKKTQEIKKARREYQKRQQRHNFNEDELEELAKEASLIKKLKRGKISKEEFEEKTDSKDNEEFSDYQLISN